MPRLGHKKSRLGCRQCKARHVKCDELKPCSNCARHGVPCSLVTWDPNAPQVPQSSAASSSGSAAKRLKSAPEEAKRPDPSPSSKSESPLLIAHVLNSTGTSHDDTSRPSATSAGSSPSSQSDQFPFLTRFIHRSEPNRSDIWARDLDLMHHWTVEAYDELSQRDDVRHTWRIEAPQYAVSHTFLMHEMLAFAAFHKAYKLPEKRAEYYASGIHHQDLTIRGIRERLQNVTAHEAPALVATSTLLTLSVFASTGFEMNFGAAQVTQNPIDGILNIFNLMQGMGNVLAMAKVQIMNSIFGTLFHDPSEATPSQPMLEELIRKISTLISFIDARSDMPIQEKQLYNQVINHLEPVLQMSMPPRVDNRELRFLFFWPLHLPPEFLSNLRSRRSGALAIIMYYTVIIFAAQPRYWFMSGWGDHLMRACLEAIDQDWIPGVQWPASFVHRDPTWNLFSDLLMVAPGIKTREQAAIPNVYQQQTSTHVPYREHATPPLTSGEQKDLANESQVAQQGITAAILHDHKLNFATSQNETANGN